MGRKSKFDLLLDTAESLFTESGYNATGINQITKAADVATMTLYNNFASKDDLIVAMLVRRADRFKALLEARIAKTPDDPCAQILSIFDVFETWYRTELKDAGKFSGCLFIRASLEFQNSSQPVREAAVRHKSDVLAMFEKLLKKSEYSKSKDLAFEMLMLIDGAIAQAQSLENKRSFKRAKSMAIRLLHLD